MKPSELERAKFVAGAAARGEVDAIEAATAADADLCAELEEQQRFDQALGVLLGPEGSQSGAVEAVMREVRKGSASDAARHSRGRGGLAPNAKAGTSGWWQIAALLVLSLGAGLLAGWLWASEASERGGLLAEQRSGGSKGNARPASPAVPVGSRSEVLALVDAARAATIEETYRQLEADLRGAEFTAARDLLIFRWAELDPEAALAFLQERENAAPEIEALFAAWARLDSRAAWEGISLLTVTALQDGAAREVLSWLSESDPRRFMELAHGDRAAGKSSWRRAFEVITSRGGDVNEFLMDLADAQRGPAIAGIADSLVARDSRAALRWAAQLEPDDRRVALAATIEAIARSDPREAGEVMSGLPDRFPGLERKIVRKLADTDPAGAMDWIRSFIAEDGRGAMYRELGTALARSGRQEVFEVFDELVALEGPDVFKGDDWFQGTIWGSSGLDYEKGFEWLQELPAEIYANRLATMRGFVFSWAKHDMAGTLDYIAKIEHDRTRNEMYSSVVHHMLSMNHPIEAAWDLARGLPEEAPQRGRAMADVLGYMARSHPAKAASRLGQVPVSADRKRLVGRIAGNWGAQAPRDAAQWASGLEIPEWRNLALQRIAAAWSSNDMYRAGEWIGTLENGIARDGAVEQLVRTVAPLEADSAFLWATTIGDAATRERATALTVEAWARQAPETARVEIEASSLPQAERERLLEALGKAQPQPQPTP